MSQPKLHLADVLADVLVQVCRHLDVSESAPGIAAALGRWMPVHGLIVRRFDADRAHLETVATGGVEAPMGERSPLPAGSRLEFAAFLQAGTPATWPDRSGNPLARATVPESVSGPVAAIPLTGASTRGVALLVGDLRDWRDALHALAEPLASALENDSRFHELTRLREAAELDRQALLERLGRDDVSEAIVGAESGLRSVMRRVEQVAPTDAPVLILGETGSGKEVIARAIHAQSRRAKGPFLRVNSGAIPPELVDSELFGHERGSFTGAIAQRKGWFERADGGTLFLDEVGELPLAAQVRLLRVLQDGTFERVGGQQAHTVDVRIVAATHRDIAAMVADGRFRQDLWYRISVFPVTLPPLRDRRADLPALTRHFAARAGVRLFGRPLVPTAAEIDQLQAWDWPGNVRELMAVIERAAILGGSHHLDVTTALGAQPPGRSEAPSAAPGTERAAIEDALSRCLGRIEGPFGAASALGVNPHTLRSRMRRLGIDWSHYRKGAPGG